jgi:NADH:ubiquinone oxidoreductase subunit 5 (subunit L)/multisubunit Na+/H+ antiporter MnhA subunit
VTALIGWLAMRFSANYLHREPGFHRFFIILSLFLAGIQLVFLAGNGLLAFVGWEMCGISSFLLIGYAWQRQVATGNALFAFITNRGGDAGFLLGLGFAATWLGTFEWPALAGASGLPLVTRACCSLASSPRLWPSRHNCHSRRGSHAPWKGRRRRRRSSTAR